MKMMTKHLETYRNTEEL